MPSDTLYCCIVRSQRSTLLPSVFLKYCYNLFQSHKNWKLFLLCVLHLVIRCFPHIVNNHISLSRYGAPGDWLVQVAARGAGHRHRDGGRLGGATVFRQLRYVWLLFSDSSFVDGLFFCSSVPLRSTLFLHWWWINRIFPDWKKGGGLYVCVNNGERHWTYGPMLRGCLNVCLREWLRQNRTCGQITAPVNVITVKTDGGNRKKQVFFLLIFCFCKSLHSFHAF